MTICLRTGGTVLAMRLKYRCRLATITAGPLPSGFRPTAATGVWTFDINSTRIIQAYSGGVASRFIAVCRSIRAGSILQQIQPVEPPSPSTNNPGLVIQEQRAGEIPPTTHFLVKRISIKGNAAFSAAALHAVVRDAEGKNLSLSQLYDLAALITDYYHRHGYPLARAIIPAQTIQKGEVEIEVIEAHFGTIGWTTAAG
jgi:POTRA domain, ShlB-type